MKLVDDWKKAYKWFSMWAFAFCGSIALIWASIPADVKEMAPDSWDKWIFVLITVASVLGGAGRLVKQNDT